MINIKQIVASITQYNENIYHWLYFKLCKTRNRTGCLKKIFNIACWYPWQGFCFQLYGLVVDWVENAE